MSHNIPREEILNRQVRREKIQEELHDIDIQIENLQMIILSVQESISNLKALQLKSPDVLSDENAFTFKIQNKTLELEFLTGLLQIAEILKIELTELSTKLLVPTLNLDKLFASSTLTKGNSDLLQHFKSSEQAFSSFSDNLQRERTKYQKMLSVRENLYVKLYDPLLGKKYVSDLIEQLRNGEINIEEDITKKDALENLKELDKLFDKKINRMKKKNHS